MGILDNLPREDLKNHKVTYGIKAMDNGSHIEMRFNFLRDISLKNWFESFTKYYSQETETEAQYTRNKKYWGRSIFVPKDNPKIKMSVDYKHSALKFGIEEKDIASRDIVCSFLERLMGRSK
jgi:hypothetical protein